MTNTPGINVHSSVDCNPGKTTKKDRHTGRTLAYATAATYAAISAIVYLATGCGGNSSGSSEGSDKLTGCQGVIGCIDNNIVGGPGGVLITVQGDETYVNDDGCTAEEAEDFPFCNQ